MPNHAALEARAAYLNSPWDWPATTGAWQRHGREAIGNPRRQRWTDAVYYLTRSAQIAGAMRGSGVPHLPMEMWIMIFEFLTTQDHWDSVVETLAGGRHDIPILEDHPGLRAGMLALEPHQ